MSKKEKTKEANPELKKALEVLLPEEPEAPVETKKERAKARTPEQIAKALREEADELDKRAAKIAAKKKAKEEREKNLEKIQEIHAYLKKDTTTGAVLDSILQQILKVAAGEGCGGPGAGGKITIEHTSDFTVYNGPLDPPETDNEPPLGREDLPS